MKQRNLSFFLALVLILNMLPITPWASKENINILDMPINWSTEALTKAVDNGLLSGYNGRLYPDNNLTRAEMATVINRAFGAANEGDISNYTDLKSTDWFYNEMAKAVAMGTFKGYANQLRPNDPITREEVFTVLANAMMLRAEKANKVFMDTNEVSAWAQESINGMINGGYLSGSNGKLNPKANITRAEFAQVMHNIIKDYINTATIHENVNAGNVIVKTPNAILKDLTIKGDLIIAEGVAEGDITLDNVKVEGRILVRAGGENSIIIKGNSEIDTIIIVKQGNKVRIFNETGKEISVVTVEGTADVILEGKFKNVIVQSPDITVYAQSAELEYVEINGTRSKVIVDEDSEIEKIVVKAANIVIEGQGTVEEVEVKAGGNGTEITTPNTLIDVNKGVKDVIGTGNIEIKPNEIYVNGRTESQDAKPLENESSVRSNGGTVTTYTVNYSVVGSNGTLSGTVTSGNSVNSGTSVTFTATPVAGYEIKEWTVNGVVVTNGNTLTRTISANTTVTVEFKEIEVAPEMYTVTYSVIGTGGTLTASVPNGGQAQAGSSVNFTAVPNEGYKVKAWSVNDEVISWLVGNNVSRDMIGDVDFKVEFEPIETHTLTLNITPSDATVIVKDEADISMPGVDGVYQLIPGYYSLYVAKEGYLTQTTSVSISADYSLQIILEEAPPAPVTYEVNIFVDHPDTAFGATVTLKNSNGDYMTPYEVLGNNNYYNLEEGTYWYTVEHEGYHPQTASIKIIAEEHQTFYITLVGYTSFKVSYDIVPDGTYNMGDDMYTVTGAGGTLTSNMVNGLWKDEMSEIWFTATPNEGYRIKTWTQDGFPVEVTGDTLTITLTKDTVITVEFEAILPGIVTVNNPPIIELNVGQDLPILPATVEVVLDTEEVVSLEVIWNVDGFDKTSPENYVLGGTLVLTEGVKNPQGLVALQLVDVFAAPEVTLEITNSNILRFDFDVPAVWVGETALADINTLYLLRELFNDPTLDYTVLNEENINKNVGPGYMEIELMGDAINRDLFFELDHPDGYYGGNGDGVYRKDVTAGLSIFNNHLGLASESTAEPFKLKFSVPYVYGLPDYDGAISGVWQTAEQRAEETDPVRDTTPPELVSITPPAGVYWVNDGEIVVLEVTADDENIYRFSPFTDIWYYALPDVYNGDETARSQDLSSGVTVTYNNNTWKIDLGEDVSANSPRINMVMDFEDYAGNKWTESITYSEGDNIYILTFSRLNRAELNSIKEDVNKLNPADYTQDSWDNLMNIINTMPETTQQEIDDKVAAIDMAIDDLVLYIAVSNVEIDNSITEIIVGQKYNLTAEVLPIDSTNKNIIWSIVSGPGQIDHIGELIANDEGLIVVKATAEENSIVYDELAFTAVLTPPNEPPVPYEGTINIDNESSKLIDVLTLSTDPENDILTLVDFEQGSHGTVAVISGSLHYDPNAGFIGTDSFSYTISDGTKTVTGTIEITVTQAGDLLTTGRFGGYEIGIYNTSSGLVAVLEGQESTTGLILDSSYNSILGIEEFSDYVTIIYTSSNKVKIVNLEANGSNVIEIDNRQTISSLDIGGTGSLNTIKYDIDSNDVIHFAYRDTNATSDDYRNDDIMYYNTNDKTPVLIKRGYRDYSSSGSWGATYVHEQPHDIAVDNNGNPIVAYYQHDIWRWYAGTDNSYFLQLKNPLTNATATPESVSVSNIVLTGGSNIILEYDIGATHYTKYFNGATLVEQ